MLSNKQKQLFTALVLSGFILFASDSQVQAKPQARVPISLSLQEPLTNVDVHCLGQPVHLISTKTICRNESCIPKDAHFEGVVRQVRKSRRFLRPGLIEISVQKATFPDGREIRFQPNLQLAIRHAEVMTIAKFSKKIAFDFVPEVGLDLVLGRTTSMSPLAQDAISLAPDFVVDYTLETLYPTVPNESRLKRVVFALLDATYIPFFISIVRKDKPLVISANDKVLLPPSNKVFQTLFLGTLQENTKHLGSKPSRIEGELGERE